jgi:hypothetical protein
MFNNRRIVGEAVFETTDTLKPVGKESLSFKKQIVLWSASIGGDSMVMFLGR